MTDAERLAEWKRAMRPVLRIVQQAVKRDSEGEFTLVAEGWDNGRPGTFYLSENEVSNLRHLMFSEAEAAKDGPDAVPLEAQR